MGKEIYKIIPQIWHPWPSLHTPVSWATRPFLHQPTTAYCETWGCCLLHCIARHSLLWALALSLSLSLVSNATARERPLSRSPATTSGQKSWRLCCFLRRMCSFVCNGENNRTDRSRFLDTDTAFCCCSSAGGGGPSARVVVVVCSRSSRDAKRRREQ